MTMTLIYNVNLPQRREARSAFEYYVQNTLWKPPAKGWDGERLHPVQRNIKEHGFNPYCYKCWEAVGAWNHDTEANAVERAVRDMRNLPQCFSVEEFERNKKLLYAVYGIEI